MLMSTVDEHAWRKGYNPLRLLLASIGSPTGGPILAEYLQKDFLQPLTTTIRGPEASERGMMLASQIVGFALMRILQSMQQGDKQLKPEIVRRLFVKSARDVIANRG
jgi:hypothetical protein